MQPGRVESGNVQPSGGWWIGRILDRFVAWIQSFFVAPRAKEAENPIETKDTPILSREAETIIKTEPSPVKSEKSLPAATTKTPQKEAAATLDAKATPSVQETKTSQPVEKRKKSTSSTSTQPKKIGSSKRRDKRAKLLTTIKELGGRRLEKNIDKLIKDHPESESYVNTLLSLQANENKETIVTSLEDLQKLPSKTTDSLDKFIKGKIEAFIQTELETVQNKRAGDIHMTKEECLATDYARILAKIIVKNDGSIDEIALKALANKEITENISFVHNKYVSKMLKRLNEDLKKNLENIKAPPIQREHSDSANFVRMVIGKKINEPLTDVDAKRAALTSLLDELYQEEISGSCYTTSLAMSIRSQYPEVFLNDIASIIQKGFYTRTINGKSYAFFPMKKALDSKLESDKLSNQTTIDEKKLSSLIDAFQDAEIKVSINNIKQIIQKKELSIKEIIKFFVLKKIGLTEKDLKLLKQNRTELLKKQSPEAEKYRQYVKLKNWVQQKFSDNRVNRLLRSWEYSIGTATLDTINVPNQTGKAGIVSTQIMNFLNLNIQFKTLLEKIPKKYGEYFFENLSILIDTKIGIEYNKGFLNLFEKTSLLNYDEKQRILTSKELDSILNSIILETCNNFLEDKTIKLKNNEREEIKRQILNYQKNIQTKRNEDQKPAIAGAAPSEAISNYCGKDIPNTTIIQPETAKDLLLKLIELSKKEVHLTAIPVVANEHAFTLLPNQGGFKRAINSDNPEAWLEKLPTETCIIIGDLNYTIDNKHCYLGIQKTGLDQYKIVNVIETEKMFVGRPEVLPNQKAILKENYFLKTDWYVMPTFSKDMEDLKKNMDISTSTNTI